MEGGRGGFGAWEMKRCHAERLVVSLSLDMLTIYRRRHSNLLGLHLVC